MELKTEKIYLRRGHKINNNCIMGDLEGEECGKGKKLFKEVMVKNQNLERDNIMRHRKLKDPQHIQPKRRSSLRNTIIKVLKSF